MHNLQIVVAANLMGMAIAYDVAVGSMDVIVALMASEAILASQLHNIMPDYLLCSCTIR